MVGVHPPDRIDGGNPRWHAGYGTNATAIATSLKAMFDAVLSGCVKPRTGSWLLIYFISS
jgi:hypothetical protein